MGRHSDNSLQESRNHTTLLASSINTIPQDSRERSQQFMQNLQDEICTALEQLDGEARFQQDHWERAEGGGVLKYSLPNSTYGLDVLAFIGWQHENEHQQLIEIQEKLNQRGIEINGRNVGKLYRQFLALLGGTIAHTAEKLAATAIEHGGLIWAIDALLSSWSWNLTLRIIRGIKWYTSKWNSVTTGTGTTVN